MMSKMEMTWMEILLEIWFQTKFSQSVNDAQSKSPKSLQHHQNPKPMSKSYREMSKQSSGIIDWHIQQHLLCLKSQPGSNLSIPSSATHVIAPKYMPSRSKRLPSIQKNHYT